MNIIFNSAIKNIIHSIHFINYSFQSIFFYALLNTFTTIYIIKLSQLLIKCHTYTFFIHHKLTIFNIFNN